MTWRDRISIDPNVLLGKPVVKGTRISVELVLDMLARGWSEPEILRQYPHLTHEDIVACINYVQDLLPKPPSRAA